MVSVMPRDFYDVPCTFLVTVVCIGALFAKEISEAFFSFPREKIQFIRTEGTPGLVRLSSDADLVMLLRWAQLLPVHLWNVPGLLGGDRADLGTASFPLQSLDLQLRQLQLRA